MSRSLCNHAINLLHCLMVNCECHRVCIKSALSNTEARSDCTDAVSLCLRDIITKKTCGTLNSFSLWRLKNLIVNWSQKLLASFGGFWGLGVVYFLLLFLFCFGFFVASTLTCANEAAALRLGFGCSLLTACWNNTLGSNEVPTLAAESNT